MNARPEFLVDALGAIFIDVIEAVVEGLGGDSLG